METPIGFGAGRRQTLQAISKKDRLTPIEDPDSVEILIGAVHEISLAGVRSPPRDTVDRIMKVYNRLPNEAQSEYLSDDLMIQRVNTARRQFNDWMGKRRRMAEVGSPIEAGLAKYPMRRAQKRSRLENQAKQELNKKLDSLQSAARGAEQRALNAIGSSVGEQTEQRRDQQRNKLREMLAEGTIVKFRNPELRAGRVIRVNKKSVRVQYPNPRAGSTCPVTGEEQPDELEDRIQLDSEYLEMLDAETIDEAVAAIDDLESRD
jgi:DNA repair exonuclease SbcCD ATPase subunit